MSDNRKSKVFVLSGPSGVGKTTLFNLLKSKDSRISKTVSVTTRSPRDGEIEGVDYFFVDDDTFSGYMSSGFLLEHSSTGKYFYGTLMSEVEVQENKIVFLIIDTSGAINVRSKIESVSIFIMPPSYEELESRLRGRGTESESDIITRLSYAKSEMNNSSFYDYILVCDDLNKCCDELYQIVLKYS